MHTASTRTRARIRRRLLPALATAVVASALGGSPSLAATPTSAPAQALPGPATYGIIMSDGRICDPIRHMGC
jgi:hypothetical protein